MSIHFLRRNTSSFVCPQQRHVRSGGAITPRSPTERPRIPKRMWPRGRESIHFFCCSFLNLFEFLRQANMKWAFTTNAREQRFGLSQRFTSDFFSMKEMPPRVNYITFVQYTPSFSSSRTLWQSLNEISDGVLSSSPHYA